MLKLIKTTETKPVPSIAVNPSAAGHHQELMENYFDSHRIRNHAPATIEQQKRIITGWFDEHSIAEDRQLLTWEAMEPIKGRQRVLAWASALINSGITSKTIRNYLGALHQYFSFVIENPYVTVGGEPRNIHDLYGRIEKPFSEFDMPRHSCDEEQRGVPIDPEKLYEFYSVIKQNYLRSKNIVTARNYTLAVLAGESGLRSDELLHLEIADLFFDSGKLQTRWAKSARGSGKRSRITLFPPLSRDTARFYLREVRPKFQGSERSKRLFLSFSGKPLLYSTIRPALCEMVSCADKAGFPVLPHMSWHWFRRIFATRFIERFPDKLHVLINLLGHMGPGTVHHYIRHSKAWVDREIVSVLEDSARWPYAGD